MPRGIKASVICPDCGGYNNACTTCGGSGQVKPARKPRTKSSVDTYATDSVLSSMVTHCLAFIDAHDKLTDRLQSEFSLGGLRHLDVIHQSEEYKAYLLYRDIADCARRKLDL